MPEWYEIQPDSLFAGLSTDGSVQALAATMAVIGGGFLVVGSVLALAKARTVDEKQATWLKALLIIAFMFAAPAVLRNARTMSASVQHDLGLSPTMLAWKCSLLSASQPEMEQIFASIRIRSTNLADQNEASRWVLNRFGNNWFGRALATVVQSQSEAAGIANILANPAQLVALIYETTGVVVRGIVKMIFTAILFLVLRFEMMMIGIVAKFMQIVQSFCLIVGTMLLPIFLGMFAMGGPWAGAARNYCINMFCVATWNLVWALGSFGTVALFNFTANACCALVGLRPDVLAWSQDDTVRSNVLQGLQDGNLAGLYMAANAPIAGNPNYMMEVMEQTVSNFLLPVIGAGMMLAWTVYVYVKLPFIYSQLIQSGTDMALQGAMQAQQTTQQVGSQAAQVAGKAAIAAL